MSGPVILGLSIGWWMIAGAVTLVGIAVYLIVRYDFDSIEGFHFSATTNERNRVGAFLLVVCVVGAANLFFVGKGAV